MTEASEGAASCAECAFSRNTPLRTRPAEGGNAGAPPTALPGLWMQVRRPRDPVDTLRAATQGHRRCLDRRWGTLSSTGFQPNTRTEATA